MGVKLVQFHQQPEKKEKSKNGKLIVDRQLALRCSACNLPFLEVADGEIIILSKHGSKKHKNSLKIEHVKMLLIEMARQNQPDPECW